MLAGLAESRSHAGDAADVLGASALAALLRAALDEVRQENALARVQKADALRAMELVGRKGKHVDVLLADVDGQMTGSLHRIGVEQDAALAADGADLGNRLDRADLVVCIHDRHEAGILADGVRDLLGRDEAVFMNIEQRDLKALLLQPLQAVQDGMMLKGGGDDVLFSLARAERGRRQQGLIVRLAAAGRERDLPGVAAKVLCHRLTRSLQGLRSLLPQRIQARGVAIALAQEGQHGIHGGLTHPRGGSIVSINVHVDSPLWCLRPGRSWNCKMPPEEFPIIPVG